jgi:hypothetical protein
VSDLVEGEGGGGVQGSVEHGVVLAPVLDHRN